MRKLIGRDQTIYCPTPCFDLLVLLATSGHARPVGRDVPGHHYRRSCRPRLRCRRRIVMIWEIVAAGSASGSGGGGAWFRVVEAARWSRAIWRQGLLVGSVVFGHCPSCREKAPVVSLMVLGDVDVDGMGMVWDGLRGKT